MAYGFSRHELTIFWGGLLVTISLAGIGAYSSVAYIGLRNIVHYGVPPLTGFACGVAVTLLAKSS